MILITEEMIGLSIASDGTALLLAGSENTKHAAKHRTRPQQVQAQGKKDVLCVSEHTQRYLIYFKNSENCRRHLYRFFKIARMKTNSPNEKQ